MTQLLGARQPQDKPVQEFDSPEEADNSGLPAGTVVLVNGRKYQI